MIHNQDQVLKYWDDENVESMYDKHLLQAEISLISQRIHPGSKILDAGCGEGEGTLVYASIPDTKVHAVDFSMTRLRKATERLRGRDNVGFEKIDFLGKYELDTNFDCIVSQRFLINLMEWDLQMKVSRGLLALLKPGGRLLMLEGSKQGVDSLNDLRVTLGLEPIPVKWHNLFLDDEELVEFMKSNGAHLLDCDGLGEFFLMTRGVRPLLDKTLDWDCEFNRIATSANLRRLLSLGTKFSRLKLWVFEKEK